MSIKSIAKLTKAVQLMAIIKLRKAGDRVTKAQIYFREIYKTFGAIIAASNSGLYQVALPSTRSLRPALWIVINSDMGLCGGYNLNVDHLVLEQMWRSDLIYLIGKKGVSFFTNERKTLYKTKLGVKIDFSFSDAQIIASDALALYNKQEVRSIKLAYTQFVNSLKQVPTVLQLLPIVKKQRTPSSQSLVTEFEPNPEAVLTTALPFYLNSIILGAVVESKLSEQAARRIAMDGATRNADELVRDLTKTYNRQRQQKITQEIIEIINGINTHR